MHVCVFVNTCMWLDKHIFCKVLLNPFTCMYHIFVIITFIENNLKAVALNVYMSLKSCVSSYTKEMLDGTEMCLALHTRKKAVTPTTCMLMGLHN